MTETANLTLPLVQPSQAQKHVTVNEALVRLDGIAQLALASVRLTVPPTPVDGVAYGVPAGATGAWAGQAGAVALASNGGWIFLAPRLGWRAWVADLGAELIWRGTGWQGAAFAVGASGGGVTLETLESEKVLVSGGQQELGLVIPAGAMVFAAAARVSVEITGALTTWSLGTPEAVERFGSGMGPGLGSYGSGIQGIPTTYYAQTPLIFTPEGGDITGGTLRLALTVMRFAVPAV